MRLIKVLLLLLVLGGVVVGVAMLTEDSGSGSGSNPAAGNKKGDAPMGVEEKYGFTSQQVGD